MSQRVEANIGHIMQSNLEIVRSDTNINSAADRMRGRRIGSLLVGEEQQKKEQARIVGIVTETDFVRKVIAQGLSAEQTPVSQIMAAPLLSIAHDRPIMDASHLMEMNHVRHVCVSEEGRIVGVVSVRDLVKYFVAAVSGPVRDLDDVYRPLSVLMRTNIEAMEANDSILAAAKRMAEKRIGSILMKENGKVVGIVTESDVVRNALPYNLDTAGTHVGSIMNSPVIDIDINRTIHDASDLMAEKGIRHLAVSENKQIVGVLSVRDLIKMISVRDRPRFLSEKKKMP